MDGNTPEDVRQYTLQDYLRLESLDHGDWCYIGIIAKAEVQTNRNSTTQTITSGGLWGIESDSGDYINQVKADELYGLAIELKAIGF